MDWRRDTLCGFDYRFNTHLNRQTFEQAFSELWLWAAITPEDRLAIEGHLRLITFDGSDMPKLGRERVPAGAMTADGELAISAACVSDPEFCRYVISHELGHARQYALAMKFELDERMVELYRQVAAWQHCESDADRWAASIGEHPPPQMRAAVEGGFPADRKFLALARNWAYLDDSQKTAFANRAATIRYAQQFSKE